MQEYKMVLQRIVSGWVNKGKQIKQKQSDIIGTSIFGIKVNLRNNSNGDNPIAIIKSKFLFPSPNANAGEIDISMIKIFMTNCMYLFRFAFAARKKEINIFDSTPSWQQKS